MIRLFAVILFLFVVDNASAQPIDSSFHNYWYDSRSKNLEQMPVKKKAIVFFGDSITEWGDWSALTGKRKVLNRGIVGDNSFGLVHRINEVLRHRPKKIFVLIGTNDINKGIPDELILQNYQKLIHTIKTISPKTSIFIQSVLPINDALINRNYYKGSNEQISELNKKLAGLAASLELRFVNVHEWLLDNDQQLAKEFTYDGLHLSGKGYLQWVVYLKNKKFL